MPDADDELTCGAVVGIAAVVGAPHVPHHRDDLLPGSQPAAGRGRVDGAGGLDTRHPGKADAHAQTQPKLQLRAVDAERLDADAHPAVPLGRERERGQPQVVHGAGGGEPDGAHGGRRGRHGRAFFPGVGEPVGSGQHAAAAVSFPTPGPQPRQINLGNATYRWESPQPKWRTRQIGARPYEKAPFTMRTYTGYAVITRKAPAIMKGPNAISCFRVARPSISRAIP